MSTLSQNQFAVERLESRRRLSAAALRSGLLTIRGDFHLASAITVDKSSDQLSINVIATSVDRHGVTNTLTKSFPLSLGITNISILGSPKGDTISVGQNSAGFAIATLITAGGGNDTVTCGAEDDVIIGNSGDDVINAGDGNNTVRGFSGNDIITTGSGNDRVDGGAGNDVISTGDGQDIIVAGGGNDSVDGGAGDDLIFGGNGRDTLLGNDGNDIIWGGGSNDSIAGGNGNDTLGGVKGTNVLLGGAGADNFIVRGDIKKDPANDYNSLEDTITLGKQDGANEPLI
ncbi:MAG TPA: calcium-binding protein [Humisphaera sp.]|jgi:Ca2+-binding RTX toxin-like protein|nr:calcium-binding protein [Humisphaera sp.]